MQEPPKTNQRQVAPEDVPLGAADDDQDMQQQQQQQQHVQRGPPQPKAEDKQEQEHSKQIMEMKNQIAALSELVQSLLAKLNTM